MRKILLALLALPAALAVAALWLWLTDPVLLSRYVVFFTPEDLTYSTLQPRESVIGDNSYQLPAATAANRSISAAAIAAMEEFADAQGSHALVVVHRGVLQGEWYKDGWSRERLTQSQSMHKSVLPILIQAAIEEGAIGSVEDRIGDYITEWSDDPRGDITIEQMLWMSSGLLEYDFSLNPFADAFLWLFAGDTLPVLLRTPLDWTPGEKFQYNNVNSELLGLIIERATGTRYNTYLQKKLWGPMGAAGAELWVDSEGGKLHTSCCLLAPAMDWARFGMMLLGEGTVNGRQIVSEKFIRRMVTPSPEFDWYGYQIWLGYSRELNPRSVVLAGGYQRIEPFLADDTYYASGYGAQRVYVVPSEELVIVRMGPASGRSPVKSDWDNTFLVNTAIRGKL